MTEPAPMRLIPLDRTIELPLTLAGGLRAIFADVVSCPLMTRRARIISRRLAPQRQSLADYTIDTLESSFQKRQHQARATAGARSGAIAAGSVRCCRMARTRLSRGV